MFKKILVPFDGSIDAGKALTSAKSIAEKFGAEILVLTIVAPKRDLNGAMTRHAVDNVNASNRESKLMGDGAIADAKQLMEGFEGKVEYRVRTGAPVRHILLTVERDDCDMVVIGCRGLSGLKKFIMGSISGQVVSDCPVPVLVAK